MTNFVDPGKFKIDLNREIDLDQAVDPVQRLLGRTCRSFEPGKQHVHTCRRDPFWKMRSVQPVTAWLNDCRGWKVDRF